ncbi:MAG: cupredoxin domain-containing protein [Burkholderiaceae bacterium]
MQQSRRTLLVGLICASGGAALAHGEKQDAKGGAAKKEQKPWGIAGDARAVKRTIPVGMTDDMRFTPDKIDVKHGETVRFTLRNNGKLMHEFVIGTRKELDEHAALMMKFPNMEHDEPYMAHVAPGKTGEIIWNFNRAGEFDFACLIAGHYQAGMVGKIKVAA